MSRTDDGADDGLDGLLALFLHGPGVLRTPGWNRSGMTMAFSLHTPR